MATGPHPGSSSKRVRELDGLLEIVNKLYAQRELLKRLRVPILIFALNYEVESRAIYVDVDCLRKPYYMLHLFQFTVN